MAPSLLFDLSGIDLNGTPVIDRRRSAGLTPSSSRCSSSTASSGTTRRRRVSWAIRTSQRTSSGVRGHIPGRPLMPGVIQIEAAAQLLSFFVKHVYKEEGFVGFGGIERAKFRAAIEPGCRLYLLGHITEARPGRRYVCDVQGVVSETLAFEATIAGLKV